MENVPHYLNDQVSKIGILYSGENAPDFVKLKVDGLLELSSLIEERALNFTRVTTNELHQSVPEVARCKYFV
jgi:hypothetical protein